MKKSTIAALGVAGVIALVLMWGVSTSNQLVNLDEQVKEKWSQVENVYQRRLDLIPNLVNTVKGYAQHEAKVLEEVAQARSQAGQIRIEKPEDLAKFEKAQAQVSGALSRLLAIAEAYPNLKADQNFLALQSQLEGTENRIAVERMRFNETARQYNIYVRTFPQTLVAGFRGFQQRPYFEADVAAKTAPKVQF